MGWEEDEQRARPDHNFLAYLGGVVAWLAFILFAEMFAFGVVGLAGPRLGHGESATGAGELIWLGLIYIGVPSALLLALAGPPRTGGGGGSTDSHDAGTPDSGADPWD